MRQNFFFTAAVSQTLFQNRLRTTPTQTTDESIQFQEILVESHACGQTLENKTTNNIMEKFYFHPYPPVTLFSKQIELNLPFYLLKVNK